MDTAITYDDIHELLRVEKNNADLQEVPEESLESIKDYFRAKKDLLAKQDKESTFSDDKKRKQIQVEIDNAKLAIKDLYEKRERKIIYRALYTVRTGSKLKDTTNMLPAEEELYEFLLKELASKRKSFLLSFSRVSPKKPSSDSSKAPSEATVAPRPESAEEELAEPQSNEAAAPELIKLKLKSEIPEIIGTDGKMYGPFEENQEAELPKELADLLIRQEKAQVIA